MSNPELKLLVLRSADLEASIGFYGLLGFSFAEERHGSGPLHYSTQIGNTVLELYPLGKRTPTSDIRLGFSIEDLDDVVGALGPESIVDSPKQVDKGRLAVVKDPDGHTIELIEL